VKPTGCNYIGKCGAGGVEKDSGHNGTMKKRFDYDYDPVARTLNRREDGGAGALEENAWSARRMIRRITDLLPIFQSAEADFDYHAAPASSEAFKGCGRELLWDTMTTLTTMDLRALDLLPRDVDKDADCMPVSGSRSMSIGAFLTMCGKAYEKYENTFKENGISKVANIVDLPDEDLDASLDEMVPNKMHRTIVITNLKRLR